MSKTKNSKVILAAAVAFLLIFSLMLASFATAASADPAAPAAEPTMAFTATGYYSDGDYQSQYKDDASLAEGLKEAITAVKLHFDIDEEIYTRVESNYNPGDGYYYIESWNIYWYSQDYVSRIYASVTTGGVLLNYYKYDSSKYDYSDSLKLAQISKTEAKNISDSFLKKILGNEFNSFRLSYESLYYPSDRYYLSYVLTKDGYDHNDYGLYVEVDKLTGEIMSFNRSGHQFFYDLSKDILSYQDASNIISKEEALDSYLDKIGLDLVYSSYFNWQTRELTVQPIYRMKNNNWNEFISAVDGSLVRLDYIIRPTDQALGGAMDNDASVAEEQEADGGVKFSEAELAAIENMDKYITANEAINAMIKAFDLKIDVSEFQQYTNLNANYINQNQYLWNINLYKNTDTANENYNATVDARTGDIIGYYSYYYDYSYKYDYDGDGKITGYTYAYPEYICTYDEAKAIALEKIKSLLPKGIDFDKNFEIVENNNYQIVPLKDEEIKAGDITYETAKDSSYYFYFVRKANGINFENNYISVGFDNEKGKVTSYNLEWYEDAKFPAIDNIITPAAALDSIADYADYNIYYVSNGMTDDGKINVSLLYVFEDSVTIDPYTGKWINGWNFEEITKYSASTLPDYKDLDDHWSKDIVSTLSDNGIYVWGGEKFDPDKGITKGEFIQYLSFYTNNYWYYTQTESSLFVNPRGYYGNNNADLDKVITKQEAMKIFCEIAGYGEIGKFHDIYVYPFKDVECDKEYKGYIAIAKAFGIIYGDGNGNFNALKTLTRAEAAAIVWNVVMVLQGGKG